MNSKLVYILQVLVQATYEGIAVGMTVAFFILLLGVQNILTTIIATVTIACSTICVVGIIPLCGWKMGVSIFVTSFD